MNSWLSRFTSPEDVNLFNPAFLAAVIYQSSKSFHDEAATYYQEKQAYMPVSLAYLVVPGVTSRQIREAFPKTKATSLTVWLEASEKYKAILQRNAVPLAPACRRAVVSGTQMGLFSLERAEVIPSPEANRKELSKLIKSTPEVQDIFKVADRLGKSFARTGDARTIFSLWGLSVG